MCDYVVLPLLNSSFEPGRAREVVEGFVDVDLRNIARAELFYFTGQAEECCEITRGYLSRSVSCVPAFTVARTSASIDGFLEPFIEHHGLLRGLIEACIRNRDPEAYQRITEGVISFSRGWMALHNPENRRKVTGELSTMEFSIAMLASGGWTNKEIGEHLGISINTVKHYLTDIFCKLNVKKRDELKKFMLK